MKYLFTAAFSLVFLSGAFAQKFYTKQASIKFESEAPMETISAINQQAVSVLDSETGEMQWSALVKSFRFDKALMQEHFNENYLESDDYPKAIFTGRLAENISWQTDGQYEVLVRGTLDMHGEQNEVEIPATIYVRDGVISASSAFAVQVADYGIKIPKVVKDNVSEQVKIYVQAQYQAL